MRYAPACLIRRAAGLAAGPCALGGFFLPWTHGPGIFTNRVFSGYDLVGAAGRLQQLNLAPSLGFALWLLRLGIVGVAVAATWQMLLAPLHQRHLIWRLSGCYVALSAALALGIGVARAGFSVPPAGLAVWTVGAVLFLVGAATRPRHSAPPCSTP